MSRENNLLILRMNQEGLLKKFSIAHLAARSWERGIGGSSSAYSFFFQARRVGIDNPPESLILPLWTLRPFHMCRGIVPSIIIDDPVRSGCAFDPMRYDAIRPVGVLLDL